MMKVIKTRQLSLKKARENVPAMHDTGTNQYVKKPGIRLMKGKSALTLSNFRNLLTT